MALAIKLRAHGFDIVSAGDGVTAMGVIHREKPDAAILDLGLPGGDGFVVLQRLRSLTGTIGLPVVVVTARPAQTNRALALEQGGGGVLAEAGEDAGIAGGAAQGAAAGGAGRVFCGLRIGSPMPKNRWTRLRVIAVAAVWGGFVFGALRQALHPAISIWTSPLATITLATTVAVALSFVLQRREEDWGRELRVGSEEGQRGEVDRALQKAEQKYRSIFENAILGIFQTTQEGEFLDVNPALARMAGYDSPEEFLNRVHRTTELYVDLKSREQLRELITEHGEVRNFEVELKTRDGSRRTILLNVRAMADRSGTNIYLEGSAQDITERKAAEARIQFLAYHDALTGLPNRALFEDRLVQALANARRRTEQIAVLWLDLDNFKTINDSLGHSIGDLVLQQLGIRLHKLIRAQDTVAKVGGDEFVFALINPGDANRAAAAAERIRKEVARGFEVQGHLLNITCSIGISLYPEHGADSEALVKTADLAMYCAKENGRNNFRFFTPELNAKAEERLALENSLRVALEKGELFLVYQPQIEIASGRMTGGKRFCAGVTRSWAWSRPPSSYPLRKTAG
jgi:diguanylate cyclase (GGDEF)-like protein/PAS domain S-box-containing protein